MIICAFVVDPSLFIVDEPFLGLDPLAISDLIQLWKWRSKGQVYSHEYPRAGFGGKDV